jgi:hypothetical protein
MESNNKISNKILVFVSIVSMSFTIIQNYKSVIEIFGFHEKPKWEGHWKMKIGSSILGETETLLRTENGKLIGSYSIYGFNKSVLSTQMIGYISNDNTYIGKWFQMIDSTFCNHGTFNLILKDNDNFQGTYSIYKKDGKIINGSKWSGVKVR